MLFSLLSLAISVSIDSLGIGITYGLRKTKISSLSKLILFGISLVITSLSISLGNLLSHILPSMITKLIGIILLVGMGLFIIYETIRKTTPSHIIEKKNPSKNGFKKTYDIILKSFGITIRIIRNPISSDFDNSQTIDAKEASYLGFALSVDALCVGIGSSMMGLGSFAFPFLVATFQLFFLSFGILLGKKILSASRIPENTWSIVSGVLLILIGFSRLFF